MSRRNSKLTAALLVAALPAIALPVLALPAVSAPAHAVSGQAAAGEAPLTAPDWEHQVVRSGAATAWVERRVSTAAGAQLRIRGTGWTTPAGEPSTVALKLNRSATEQHQRSGAGVVVHPSAPADTTIWVLLAPGGGQHANVRAMRAGGEFDVTIDLPAGLDAGDYLAVQFQSGRFDPSDTVRSVSSGPLLVGGTPWVGTDPEPEPGAACDAGGAAPSITLVDDQIAVGEPLRIAGAGWCHPTDGGSAIAIKLDEGAYSRVDTSLHSNKTIWAIVQAAADGTFAAELELPDGTTATSVPAFPSGSHTLRLLTGSIKPNDEGRTVKSAPFTVGGYRPAGTPDPVEAGEQLTAATRGGLSATQRRGRLVVQLPAADRPSWVFLSAYADDGSPRYPWAAWHQVPADGRIEVAGRRAQLPEGTVRLVAQRGDRGRVGELVGWTTIRGARQPATPPAHDNPGPGPTASPTPSPQPAPASPVLAAAPALVEAPAAVSAPAPALPTEEQLLAALPDPVPSTRRDGTLRITVPRLGADEQVFVAVYNPPTAIGWARTDAKGSFAVDVAALGGASHRIAVLDPAGRPLAWSWSSIPPRTSVVASSALDTAPVATAGESRAAGEADRDPVTETDLWLIIAGLLGLLAASWWSRRPMTGVAR